MSIQKHKKPTRDSLYEENDSRVGLRLDESIGIQPTHSSFRLPTDSMLIYLQLPAQLRAKTKKADMAKNPFGFMPYRLTA